MARELTNSLPCVLMVLSHAGGDADCCDHVRTVKSREADTMSEGDGKSTPRTCSVSAANGDNMRGSSHYRKWLTSSSWPRSVADSLKSPMVEVARGSSAAGGCSGEWEGRGSANCNEKDAVYPQIAL